MRSDSTDGGKRVKSSYNKNPRGNGDGDRTIGGNDAPIVALIPPELWLLIVCDLDAADLLRLRFAGAPSALRLPAMEDCLLVQRRFDLLLRCFGDGAALGRYLRAGGLRASAELNRTLCWWLEKHPWTPIASSEPGQRARWIARFLEAHGDAFDPRVDDNQLMVEAVRGGHAQVVRWLLEDGRADPTIRILGSGMLGSAAHEGSVDIVDMLLRDGRVDPAVDELAFAQAA